MNTIRNFSIIAHIDHGKSTLADRMLEITGTVEARKMKEQVLDSMELERERGITIKMQPVTMRHTMGGSGYTLNLIDTPGHIDFHYEVSRALKAVEGAILLVDSTQGVQAQTLSTLRMAQEAGLVIVPALSKVDSPLARVEEVAQEVATLLGCDPSDVLHCSGKTGVGVLELLKQVIEQVPAPVSELSDSPESLRGLVFDFQYDTHRGVIVYIRVLDGKVMRGDTLAFKIANEKFNAIEVGIFSPEETPVNELTPGSIGYIVTGIKKPGIASVGDTLVKQGSVVSALSGYMRPTPMVWASVYPESQDDFTELKQALLRLSLSDSSLSFEEETSGVMGRGYRCGFLGMLHLEIVTERLRREFDLEIVVTTPSITYEIVFKGGEHKKVYSAIQFPESNIYEKVLEPWVAVEIIVPADYIGAIMQLLFEHEAIVGDSENFGDDRIRVAADMPLRELMRNFFDQLKNASSGFASILYEVGPMLDADVIRLDVLISEEVVPAFSRIVARRRVQEEAEAIVERLSKLLPRQQVVVKIQGRALGRILASRKLSALKKDVTGHLYGGDITRKRKLWEKQKKGKKKMQLHAKVNIPQDVFLKVMRGDERK
ncbi:MAG: translation elongation factor 4 [Candidatus Pacebacteria bacterium]|nr:translation elongation factor 4 [Candidatus Paceibacterota bacterium]